MMMKMVTTLDNSQEHIDNWLQQIIDYSDFSAFHDIGWVYDDVLHDNTNAMMYYRLSIEFHNKNTRISKYNLADMLIKDSNIEDALEICNQMMDDDDGVDSDVYYLLGRVYTINDNIEKAIEYFQLGVDDGRCMNHLGNIYKNKLKDCAKAKEYYQLGVNLNNGQSVDNLSQIYRHGCGCGCERKSGCISQNIDKEFETLNSIPYEKLTRYGKYNLAWFYKSSNKYKDYAKSLKIHTELVDTYNDEDSLYMIGTYYQYGYDGHVVDPHKAIEYYIKSNNNGCADAYNKLVLLMNNAIYKDILKSDSAGDYFRKLMKNRATRKLRDYNNSNVKVDLVVMDDIMIKYYEMEQRLLEYDLAPPLDGGKLYKEARERYIENTRI